MDKITKLPTQKVIMEEHPTFPELYLLYRPNEMPIGEISGKENAEKITNFLNGSHEGLVNALKDAHACATVKDDGSCEGCFVSEALKKAADGEGV